MQQQFNVLHLIASGGVYGAESVIINLSKELIRTGIRPIVGVLHENKSNQKKLAIVCRALGIETVEFTQRGKFDLTIVNRLRQCIKIKKIHLIHSHGYKATVLSFIPSLISGRPLTVTCHLWSHEGDLKLKLYHQVEACLMRFLPMVVGVSEKIRRDIIKKGVKKERVKTIYNGIDLANYRQHSKSITNSFLSQLGIVSEDFVVGTIGRIDKQKAQHILIEAFGLVACKYKNIKCVIVGEGKLRENLQRQSVQLGLQNKVFFAGYREDVINILERLDVFVLTSIDEGLPMVLLEAMATKTAIVTTPVGQISEIISNYKNGIVFPTGDVEALAKAINLLYENRELKARLSREAFITFNNNYSSSKMAIQYQQLYKQMLL